jgi:hypothetical protein
MPSTWDRVRDQLGDRLSKIATLMDDAKTELLAFAAHAWSHAPERAVRTRR